MGLFAAWESPLPRSLPNQFVRKRNAEPGGYFLIQHELLHRDFLDRQRVRTLSQKDTRRELPRGQARRIPAEADASECATIHKFRIVVDQRKAAALRYLDDRVESLQRRVVSGDPDGLNAFRRQNLRRLRHIARAGHRNLFELDAVLAEQLPGHAD